MLTDLLDTRYFTLSNENYRDRKRDAEERVEAVVAFVNNNQECRSVQLLRYFNEASDRECGKCDVCVNHSEQRLGAGEYEDILQCLLPMLRERPLTVNEAVEACVDHEEEETMEAIRWMVDLGKLRLDGNVLTL